MSKRCHICDGPIVNGRCKFCGMPYRNDEDLYHLNESRSEHYRHASNKIRREMDENQIPLADRQAAQAKKSVTRARNKAAGNSTARSGNTTAGTGTARSINTTVGSSAARNRSTVRGTASPGKNAKTAYKESYEKLNSKKKSFGLKGVLILLVILLGAVPELMNFVKENVAPRLETVLEGDSWETSALEDTDTYDDPAYAENEEGAPVYLGYLTEEDGGIPAGKEGVISAGTYQALILEGYADISIKGNGEEIEYALNKNEQQVEFTISEGQTLAIINADKKDREVELYLVEEN